MPYANKAIASAPVVSSASKTFYLKGEHFVRSLLFKRGFNEE